MTVRVRAMTPRDWPSVETIYREGIATGNETFESEPPTWEEFDRARVMQPRLVAVDGGTGIGAVLLQEFLASATRRGCGRFSRESSRRTRAAWRFMKRWDSELLALVSALAK